MFIYYGTLDKGYNTMDLSKEEQILYRHFDDLIKLADRRGTPVFSGFAGLNEMGLMYKLLEDKGITGELVKNYVITFGGYPYAERQIVCFLPNTLYKVGYEDFPVDCVRIRPVNHKFCDALTHRDFLGTVMNIGIERDQIGDIIIKREGENQLLSGYIFCRNDKTPLLIDITRIRHTAVHAEITDGTLLEYGQKYKDITGSVSSMRLDAVVSVAVKTSRSKCLALVKEGSIFLNGRCCTEGSKNISGGDVISIRGYGKYKIELSQSVTKKGRYHITVKQYI